MLFIGLLSTPLFTPPFSHCVTEVDPGHSVLILAIMGTLLIPERRIKHYSLTERDVNTRPGSVKKILTGTSPSFAEV